MVTKMCEWQARRTPNALQHMRNDGAGENSPRAYDRRIFQEDSYHHRPHPLPIGGPPHPLPLSAKQESA